MYYLPHSDYDGWTGNLVQSAKTKVWSTIAFKEVDAGSVLLLNFSWTRGANQENLLV
jgi:hypothetical protein